MAQSKATAESLMRFSNELTTNREEIINVKAEMDRELNNFLWDDPVGQYFKSEYFEKLKPIESKLVPNLQAYCNHLDQEARIITEYGEN